MSKSPNTRIFGLGLALALTLSALAASLVSCDEKPQDVETTPEETEDTTELLIGTDSPYLAMDLSEYIKINAYTGLTINITDPDVTKGEAVWERVVSDSTVLKYPEEQVEYYFSQTKEKYMNYASGDLKQYEYVLKHFKVTEESMMDEAREMVKKDLVYYYMVKEAELDLTEDEKLDLFDKYVDFYVESYKYPREYVIANMTDLIYDSMLYDKTIEYLILNNKFIIETEETDIFDVFDDLDDNENEING